MKKAMIGFLMFAGSGISVLYLDTPEIYENIVGWLQLATGLVGAFLMALGGIEISPDVPHKNDC